jgi:hypothetical protein
LSRFSLRLLGRFNLGFLSIRLGLLDNCGLGSLLSQGFRVCFGRLRLSLDLGSFWLGLFNRLWLSLLSGLGRGFGRRSFRSRLLSRCCLGLFRWLNHGLLSGFSLGLLCRLSLDFNRLSLGLGSLSFLSRFRLSLNGLGFSLRSRLDLGFFGRLLLHFGFGFLDTFGLDLSAGFLSWLGLDLFHNLGLGFLGGLDCGFGCGLGSGWLWVRLRVFGRLCLDLGSCSLGFLRGLRLDLLSWFSLGLLNRVGLGLSSRGLGSRLSLGIFYRLSFGFFGRLGLGRFLRGLDLFAWFGLSFFDDRFRLDLLRRLSRRLFGDRLSLGLLSRLSLSRFDKFRRSLFSS